jgi:hypothetical protein
MREVVDLDNAPDLPPVVYGKEGARRLFCRLDGGVRSRRLILLVVWAPGVSDGAAQKRYGTKIP